MIDEYQICVGMTPHEWDSPDAPYVWSVQGFHTKHRVWCNCGCGWAKTPQQAWEDAMKYYSEKMEKKS